MRFLAPHWLWALLLIPLAVFFLFVERRRKGKQFSQFADSSLWSFIAPELDMAKGLQKGIFGLAAFGFAILALARPQYGSHEESVHVSGLDIVVALDVSSSMEVGDVVPSRLQKAKHLLHTTMDRLGGDRIGLVAFAGSSYVACPLTTDLYYVWDTLQILGPKTIQNQGTDIGTGLETALNALERGGVESTSTEPNAPPSHAVILISDGEDQEESAIQIAGKFKETGTRLYVLGVGTETGGPIPLKDDAGNSSGFKKDRAGRTIMSTFRPGFLQDVAKAANGKYWNITTGETEVEEILSELGALNRSDYSERRYLVYDDQFQIPLFIAILLLFLEISIPARKILTGFLLIWSFASSSSAKADLKNPPSLDAYWENRKGLKAFQSGNMEEAERGFGAAQARDPSRPELEFNQGVVEFQKGETDRAIHSFESSLRSAREKGNQKLEGKSLYNLGNAYAKKGDVKEAVKSYVGAVNSAMHSGDSALEYEARKNLQLLVHEDKKQKDKQKQQEQKDKQEKDKDSKESKDSGEKKDHKDGSKENSRDKSQESGDQSKDKSQENSKDSSEKTQDQKESKDKNGEDKESEEDKRYRESPKTEGNKQFESKKMTKEDADRVMSELTTRERALQEKLQKQNGKSHNNPKDW